MPYSPVPYTTAGDVNRILRSSKGKIKIGNEPNDHLTSDDLDAYILDASRFMDAVLMKFITSGNIPIVNHTYYPEIGFAAPRIASFLIYKDLYREYRSKELPVGPRGWIEDANDFLKIFKENLDAGAYSALSPSTDGPSWETVTQFFQTKIGINAIHEQENNVTTNIAPTTSGDNLGPWNDS